MGALGTGIGYVSVVHCSPRSSGLSRSSNTSYVVLATTTAAAKSSFPRLRVCSSRRRCGVVACLNGENARNDFEPCVGTSNAQEAKIDIGLPRRSLLVQFTCDACGDRTSRLINRVAYERGTVFLQCGGCQVYHKFVDNLGLVVEYDFREEQPDDDMSTEDS